MCQKIWAGVSPSLPIPKLTQYIQFVKSGQKIWAGPPPLIWTKSKRTATFFGKPFLTGWNIYGLTWHSLTNTLLILLVLGIVEKCSIYKIFPNCKNQTDSNVISTINTEINVTWALCSRALRMLRRSLSLIISRETMSFQSQSCSVSAWQYILSVPYSWQ